MSFISVPGAKLYYEEHGQGEPLLVTGCPSPMLQDAFGAVLPILAESYRVIYFDARMSPKSQMTSATLEDLVADVGRVMDALGLDSAHLVGECHSANLTLEFAHRNPARVRSLFVSDLVVQVHPHCLAAPEDYPYRNQLPRHPGEWAFVSDYGASVPNGSEWLKQLKMPAFLLYGGQDPMYVLPGFAEAISVNPKIPQLSWPGVRHMEIHEPEEMAGIILEFLDDPGAPIRRQWKNIRPSSIPPGERFWC